MNIDLEDFIQQMKQVIGDENRAMEARLEQKLEQKLDEKFDQKLAPIFQEIEDIKLILDTSFTATQEQLDNHETRITRLETTRA